MVTKGFETISADVIFPDDSAVPHQFANMIRVIVDADEATMLFYGVTPPTPEMATKTKGKGKVTVQALLVSKVAVPKSVALKLIDVLEGQRGLLENLSITKKKTRKRRTRK